MRRIAFSVLFVLCISVSLLSAAVHNSVPIGNRVYQVLEVAETRGLIENQSDVKPYSASKVLRLLFEIEKQKEKLTNSEQVELEQLIAELQTKYGTEPSLAKDLLSTGYLRTYDETKGIGASLGVTLGSQQTVSMLTGEYDSRNSVGAYIKGDLGQYVSFNMDVSLLYDKLNTAVFIPTEFTIPGEGWYQSGSSVVTSIPFDSFATSYSFAPELNISLFDGDVFIRWGSIKRDWGPGINNLALSGSARTFDGVELHLNLTDWLRFSVMNGSLGKFSLEYLDGEPFFSDYSEVSKEEKINSRFDNNFSIQRVELDVTKNLTLSVFESMVWLKRFELSYLNPFAIYMFQQNVQGDIDEKFAGLDFAYTLSGKVRLYGSVGMNEMHVLGSLETILKSPRNMLAFQAGMEIPLPIGNFSSLTFQWTYIGPFVYSHYPLREYTGTIDTSADSSVVSEQGHTFTYDATAGTVTYYSYTTHQDEVIDISDTDETEWFSSDGRTMIQLDDDGNYNIYETYAETSYTNKGENLGYPLDPNSQEFLLQFDLGLPRGWATQVQAKYQARSGQYGYEIDQFMYYADDDSYELQDFWNNIFKHTLSLKFKVTKEIDNTPITVSAAYQFTTVWERSITKTFFDGRDSIYGAWDDPEYDHIVQIGIKVFY